MKGLKFKIKNEYDKVLNKIFYGIDCSDCKWKIVSEEVLGERGQEFFTKYEYEDEEFRKIIKSEYYPIFLNLQMFHKSQNITKLNSYNDFLKSSCELALFITDNIYVDVFVKSQNTMKKIYENAIYFDYTNIEYIKEGREMDRLLSLYTD